VQGGVGGRIKSSSSSMPSLCQPEEPLSLMRILCCETAGATHDDGKRRWKALVARLIKPMPTAAAGGRGGSPPVRKEEEEEEELWNFATVSIRYYCSTTGYWLVAWYQVLALQAAPLQNLFQLHNFLCWKSFCWPCPDGDCPSKSTTGSSGTTTGVVTGTPAQTTRLC
jgi:hypothetical protein